MSLPPERPPKCSPTAPESTPMIRLTRRNLVRGSGALIATSTAGLIPAGCTPFGNGEDGLEQTPIPVSEQYPAVPPAPATPPPIGTLRFFSEQEAAILDPLVATIMPGSPEDPGAREAGVLNYIDHLLASSDTGFAQPTYLSPPFAIPYDGDTPPAADDAERIYVPRDLLYRYGYQSPNNLHEIYRQGLAAIDEIARSQFGTGFAGLSTEQLEQFVGDIASSKELSVPSEHQTEGTSLRGIGEAGGGVGYFPPAVEDFFETVRTHVIQGMFSDPLYGGNVDFAGWRLVGYPGAQRAYTPRDIAQPGTDREPQSLAQLPVFHPGHRPIGTDAEDNVILPVSGSDPFDDEDTGE